MDPASIPPIPQHVELVIYGYFLLVAAIGCYLHGRLWFGTRDETSRADGSRPDSP